MIDDLVFQIDAHDAAHKMKLHRRCPVRSCAVYLPAFYIISQHYTVIRAHPAIERQIARVPAVPDDKLTATLAVAQDAACVIARLDGNVVAVYGKCSIGIASCRQDQSALIRRSLYCRRHMTVIQTRKQPLIALTLCCGQRFQNRFAAFRAYLAGPIGPLVADDAAHKGLTADHAQGILRTQTVRRHFLPVQLHHVRADDAAHIIAALHAPGFNDQLRGQDRLGRVEAKAAAYPVAVAVNPAADQIVFRVQDSLYVVKACDTAHIASACHDTRDRFYHNLLACAVKCDRPVIVACDAAHVIAGGLPFIHDHIVDGAVIVGQVAYAVLDLRLIFIIADDAARVFFRGCGYAVIDTVFKSHALGIDTGDAARIIFTDDIATISCN